MYIWFRQSATVSDSVYELSSTTRASSLFLPFSYYNSMQSITINLHRPPPPSPCHAGCVKYFPTLAPIRHKNTNVPLKLAASIGGYGAQRILPYNTCSSLMNILTARCDLNLPFLLYLS